MFVPYPSPLSASFFYFTTFHGKMEKVFRKEKEKENPKALSSTFILLFLPQFQRQYPQLLLLFLHFLLPLLEG